LQANTFIGKDKEPGNRKQDTGNCTGDNPNCVMPFLGEYGSPFYKQQYLFIHIRFWHVLIKQAALIK